MISAGGDILVAGSEVFGSDNPVATIKEFYKKSEDIGIG